MFKWAIIVVSTIVLLTALAIGYLVWRFDKDSCQNSIQREVASPDGVYKAIVFGRECGAETGFSTQVSILSASNAMLPNQPGNTLKFNGHNVPISVVWISGNEVSISGSGSKASYSVKTIKNKVAIHLVR